MSSGAPTAFREDAPRPPVPGGEEEECCSSSSVVVEGQPPTQRRRPPCGEAGGGVGGDAVSASSSSPSSSSSSPPLPPSALLGCPPEGAPEAASVVACEGVGVARPSSSSSPPPQLRWARHLHALLEDPEGVALFRRFLEQEGPAHADTLDFWFACEGLKKQRDPERTAQLVKVIHRRFFVKTQLAIPEELRKEVNRRVKEGGPGGHVFDSVQAQVERLITETTYPNFLRGELYLQHVQALQGGGGGGVPGDICSPGSSSGSSGAGSGGGGGVGGTGLLPTLHEDAELTADALPLPLTRDTLLATQRRRHELRPRPEAFAGMYLQHGPVPPPHPAYSSYNPVSRQDSELQSLSSDARTESDNMSLTDSSVDGASQGRGRRRHQQLQQRLAAGREGGGGGGARGCGGGGLERRGGGERGGGGGGEREAAVNLLQVNRDAHLHHVVIPRTQRLQRDQLQPLPPPAFAQLLCSKLEAVLREREVHDVLQAKLHDGGGGGCGEPTVAGAGTGAGAARGDCGEERAPECPGAASARSLPDAIREKLQIDDDSDQAILDQHVSRVWSDLTPARSPGLISPRPRSPEGRRQPSCTKMGPCPAMAVHPSHALRTSHCPRHAHTRKEKDVFSTFSSDSGNVHDFPEGPDLRHHMPKSKSMPLDHQEAQKQEPFAPLQGYDPRFRQSRDGCRRSSSKKTLTDLTDSGVSVVSDSAPVAPLSQSKDSRVLSWLLESEKSEREGTRHTRVRCQPLATSPGASRHGLRRSTNGGGGGSRSGSLERGTTCAGAREVVAAAGGNGGAWGGVGAPGPAQPFVADPSMPPLPTPHTDSQLEEARRRLLEASAPRAASRHGGARPCTHLPPEPLALPCSSGPPTLRKGGSRQRAPCVGPPCHTQGPFQGQGEPPDFTTVVFSFCDEQFPYRTKIPGRSITLRQFKEYLPKKGSYRFFFKTECEDLDTKVIHEEVTEDNDVLPLWEGKVMAQVKPVD